MGVLRSLPPGPSHRSWAVMITSFRDPSPNDKQKRGRAGTGVCGAAGRASPPGRTCRLPRVVRRRAGQPGAGRSLLAKRRRLQEPSALGAGDGPCAALALPGPRERGEAFPFGTPWAEFPWTAGPRCGPGSSCGSRRALVTWGPGGPSGWPWSRGSPKYLRQYTFLEGSGKGRVLVPDGGEPG